MLFSKKGNTQKPPQEEKIIGFEPEDKPTPTLGKLLLIIMAGLLIALGTYGLNDIRNIPQKPTPLSYCSRTYDSSYKGYSSNYYDLELSQSANCNFSKYEINHKIPEIYKKYESSNKELAELNKQKNSFQTQINQLDNQIVASQREYDLSLQENIANEQRVGLNPEQHRQRIKNLQDQKQNLLTNLSTVNSKIQALDPTLKAASEEIRIASEKAQKDYNHDRAIYNFKVFIIQALFVFPIFAFFLKLYFNLKAKDSPHTIIATTLVAVSGLFAFGITLTYLWSSFLQDILSEIFKLIADFPLFRTLFFYVAMLVVIAVFGGSVYHLQKKIFDPTRVLLRRLRSKKCPFCEFPFGFSKSYCPSCGKQLMEKCKNCSNLRYTIMKHCPNCGNI